jgi:hypothetical protein
VKRITQKRLNHLIKKHQLWLDNNLKGKRLELVNYNLSKLDMSYSNLEFADFSGSNLTEIKLIGANLSGASFTGADITNVYGKRFLIFTHNQHTAIYVDGQLQIGCKIMSPFQWLKCYKEVGQDHIYTKEEIKSYGQFICYCVKQDIYRRLKYWYNSIFGG